MGEQDTGPGHIIERHHERAADPADTADRPLEPRSSGDPYRSETTEDDSDRASGIRGAGQGDEKR